MESFGLKAAKTKDFRKTLDALEVKKTVLLVDSEKENRNLELSARNLQGVEMMRGRDVHPYHLLRYDRAIFARPALEKLQETLKASAPKRKAQEVAE